MIAVGRWATGGAYVWAQAFFCIYIISGLAGNLVSLVVQGNSAVSGGASGAIFGFYGAALVFLWRERAAIAAHEFRWLFWGL